MDTAARLPAAHGASASHGEEMEDTVNPIRTPYGVAPADDPPPPVQAQLRALCGDLDLVEADVAHQGAEISLAIAEIYALRRRITALERREPYRRHRGAIR
jgi:hypothetical protein